MMPQDHISESFINAFKGAHLNSINSKIKNVVLGTNPLRISFLGKQIMICRYDFMKKIK
jgi:hypothetical protein